MSRWAPLLLVTAFLAGCRSADPPAARYIVTVVPFQFLAPSPHPGFCVAVDPEDASGVWWWEPGRTGCISRSTGPSVFPADAATVSRSSSGAIEVAFEIQMKRGQPRRIRLEVHEDHMRELPSGRTVSAVRRARLEVSEMPPRARSGADGWKKRRPPAASPPRPSVMFTNPSYQAFFDPLRADPRFADLVRRIGLPKRSST